MPNNFDDELHPRSAIPISDAEIEDVFERLQDREERKSVETGLGQDSGLRTALMLDVGLWSLLFALALRSRGVPLGVALIGALLLIGGFGLSAMKSGIPFGFFTARHLKERKERTRQRVSTGDVQLLADVVDEIAGVPIRQSEELQAQIQGDRASIAQSVLEVTSIDSSLEAELLQTEDDALRHLIEGRRIAAREALSNLEELDRELADRAKDAEEAVKPVRAMKQQFDRLHRLSGSLSKIREAHSLAGITEDRLEQQRLEVKALRIAAAEASSRLQEIQDLVEARERAQAELDA